MVNTLQRLILVDEGSKGQLSDIVEYLAISQGQVRWVPPLFTSYMERPRTIAVQAMYRF